MSDDALCVGFHEGHLWYFVACESAPATHSLLTKSQAMLHALVELNHRDPKTLRLLFLIW